MCSFEEKDSAVYSLDVGHGSSVRTVECFCITGLAHPVKRPNDEAGSSEASAGRREVAGGYFECASWMRDPLRHAE